MTYDIPDEGRVLALVSDLDDDSKSEFQFLSEVTSQVLPRQSLSPSLVKPIVQSSQRNMIVGSLKLSFRQWRMYLDSFDEQLTSRNTYLGRSSMLHRGDPPHPNSA